MQVPEDGFNGSFLPTLPFPAALLLSSVPWLAMCSGKRLAELPIPPSPRGSLGSLHPLCATATSKCVQAPSRMHVHGLQVCFGELWIARSLVGSPAPQPRSSPTPILRGWALALLRARALHTPRMGSPYSAHGHRMGTSSTPYMGTAYSAHGHQIYSAHGHQLYSVHGHPILRAWAPDLLRAWAPALTHLFTHCLAAPRPIVLLQMMGRAGRPQYDRHGVAVIMVHEPKKQFYKRFLYEPFPVESSLQHHVRVCVCPLGVYVCVL